MGLNRSKQTDWFFSACHRKLGFNSNYSSESVQLGHTFAACLHEPPSFGEHLVLCGNRPELCVCTSTDLRSCSSGPC